MGLRIKCRLRYAQRITPYFPKTLIEGEETNKVKNKQTKNVARKFFFGQHLGLIFFSPAGSFSLTYSVGQLLYLCHYVMVRTTLLSKNYYYIYFKNARTNDQ